VLGEEEILNQASRMEDFRPGEWVG
jgi:hypothetical protein